MDKETVRKILTYRFKARANVEPLLAGEIGMLIASLGYYPDTRESREIMRARGLEEDSGFFAVGGMLYPSDTLSRLQYHIKEHPSYFE